MDYEQLVFPRDLQSLIREVREGAPTSLVPDGWHNIIIYHPYSNSYYASKSQQPLVYEEIVREKKGQRYDLLAYSLRYLLEQHPQFQFFVSPINARPLIESWLAASGRRRVATRRGEVTREEHLLFRVYSHEYNVERFVCAPKSTPKDKIIKKANLQLTRWLRTPGIMHQHERETMRIALHSKFRPNEKVFNLQSRIDPRPWPEGVTHQNVSAYTAEANLLAVRAFIMGTVTGQAVPAQPRY